jgi:transcription elongation factor Elf1
MARVYVEERAYFECPTCGHESQVGPGTCEGRTVVCATCGASHRVAECGYMEVDWNKINREQAKRAKV